MSNPLHIVLLANPDLIVVQCCEVLRRDLHVHVGVNSPELQYAI